LHEIKHRKWVKRKTYSPETDLERGPRIWLLLASVTSFRVGGGGSGSSELITSTSSGMIGGGGGGKSGEAQRATAIPALTGTPTTGLEGTGGGAETTWQVKPIPFSIEIEEFVLFVWGGRTGARGSVGGGVLFSPSSAPIWEKKSNIIQCDFKTHW